jgi:hypothetical protein
VCVYVRAFVCVYVRIHMLVDAGVEENHENLKEYGVPVWNAGRKR